MVDDNYLFLKLGLNLKKQVNNVLFNSGFILNKDYFIKDKIITINNEITFKKVSSLLRETKFKIKELPSKKIRLQT